MCYVIFWQHMHDVTVSPATVGMSLLILNHMPILAVSPMFQQLSWHAAVKPVLALGQQLACIF
jgi:hypothetical protein